MSGVKHVACRVIALPQGAGLTIPLRLFDNERAATEFCVEQDKNVAQLAQTELCLPSPEGLLPVGVKQNQFLANLMGGPFSVRHVILAMEESGSVLEVMRPGLVDPSGRPV